MDDYYDQCHLGGLNLWLGLCYYFTDKVEKAIPYLKVAYDLIDTFEEAMSKADIHYRLGLCCWELDLSDDALKYFSEGEKYLSGFYELGLYDNCFYYHFIFSKVYRFYDMHESIIDQCQKAQKFVSDDYQPPQDDYSVSQYLIAESYYSLKNWNRALSELDRVNFKALPELYKKYFYVTLLRTLIAIEDYQRIMTVYEEVKKVNIHMEYLSELYNYFGQACYYLSKGPESRECFEKSNSFLMNQDWLSKSNQAYLKELKKAGY